MLTITELITLFLALVGVAALILAAESVEEWLFTRCRTVSQDRSQSKPEVTTTK